MYFGCCYYPEHWEEKNWEPDLVEMKAHGFNMVRVAEFAWSRLEPAEGTYDFAWLDRFVALCGKHGFDIMMGLPVRLVPAWLWAKDPGMAIIAEDGTRESFGTRYTTCLSNRTLRSAALRLTTAMAEHFGANERLASWQLDNEYGDASTCFCEACRQKFITWLQEKYGSLEALNREWGMAFWSMDLTAWDQVWVPKKTNHFQRHPSLLQEYARFTSHKTEEIARAQCGILREKAPGKAITTNIQSTTRDHTDYGKMCIPLDAVSTNYYPPVMYNTVDLDRTRGFLGKNFWVVEQKSGAPGSATFSTHSSPPGMTRLYTYQSIGHGADMVLYYRWRSSYFGNEQFYMGIRSYDGGDNRISREIRGLAQELPAVAKELEGSWVKNDVALVWSQDSAWAMRSFKPHEEMDYREVFLTHYRALEKRHIGTDIVGPYDDLSGYKVAVLPLLYLLDDRAIKNIRSFVEKGGRVVATTRCGAKDTYARMTRTVLPLGLQELFGSTIPEVLSLEGESSLEMQGGDSYQVTLWAELLEAVSAKVLGRYSAGWYRGYAAVTGQAFGKGSAIYVGCLPGEDFFTGPWTEYLLEAGVKPLAQGAASIQACRRTDGSSNYTFLLNASSQNGFIAPEEKGIDLLTGMTVSGTVELSPGQVLVIKS